MKDINWKEITKISLILSGLLVILGMTTCTGIVQSKKYHAMQDSIAKGGDPIAVACAYRGDGKDPICVNITN